MCIAYRSKANTDEVMCMEYETKENHSRRRSCLLNITYYKLWAGKHFVYYIIGQGVKGYRVSGARKILNQTLMRLENRGEEDEDCGQNGLVQQPTPWQHHDKHHEERPP